MCPGPKPNYGNILDEVDDISILRFGNILVERSSGAQKLFLLFVLSKGKVGSGKGIALSMWRLALATLRLDDTRKKTGHVATGRWLSRRKLLEKDGL